MYTLFFSPIEYQSATWWGQRQRGPGIESPAWVPTLVYVMARASGIVETDGIIATFTTHPPPPHPPSPPKNKGIYRICATDESSVIGQGPQWDKEKERAVLQLKMYNRLFSPQYLKVSVEYWRNRILLCFWLVPLFRTFLIIIIICLFLLQMNQGRIIFSPHIHAVIKSQTHRSLDFKIVMMPRHPRSWDNQDTKKEQAIRSCKVEIVMSVW